MEEVKIIKALIKAFKAGKKVIICGCGGSSSQASHFAGEFMCRYKEDRKPLPAIALNDPAILTAISNDYSFDVAFSRQVEALGNKGDVLIALSTSGKSKVVLNAIKTAKKKGMVVVDFTKISKKDHELKDTGIVQSDHVYAMHYICQRVEEYFKYGKVLWKKT